MSLISEHIKLDAPVEESWAALADYGRPHHYFATIVDAHIIGNRERGTGAVRHCDLPGRGNNYIVEEITDWNEGSSFTYIVTDTNAPITDASVTWSVERAGTGSVVGVEIRYEPRFGIAGKLMDSAVLKRQFRASIVQGLASLKSELEEAPTMVLSANAAPA